MFLKSIEIRGFKSFADKTEISFKKGITAVVGPNGSGKSNISDAVKWVLGEQSVRNLRGDKMEDVIFAGTQFRKPVSLAQVSLTLDNCDCELNIDYSNVTISRRLYRSGESEYLINNTVCRLKDVQQLFMDTGIGKEGYSIIGQGKIDAILSGKTEERRKLIEEAAGIVKFKTRKEEAEKRLESTEQNLIRIKDILSTYEERLEPLMKESEKAKSFLKLFDELKSKEVNIIIYSINKVEEKIKSLGEEYSKLNLETENLMKEKSQFKNEVEHWSEQLEILENKNQGERQLYYDNKLIYQNGLSEINILNERIENLVRTMDRAYNESENINKKLLELKESVEQLNYSLNDIKNTEVDIEKNIQVEELKIKDIKESISTESEEAKALKDEQQKSSDKIAENTNNLFILNNNMDVSQKRIDILKNTIEGFSNTIKINSITKKSIEDQMKEFGHKVLVYENNIEENKKEIGKLQKLLTADDIDMKNCNLKINKTEANFNILTTLEKKHEGYNKSVKNLMQHINEGRVGNPQECFVLGEVIKVEKSLEIAIEIALGGSISHIITKDEVVAKTLISYLKSSSLGRATFLPLNIIKGKKLTVDINTKNNAGFIGIASELITYDEKFSEVMAFILGKTIICRDMDSALEISKNNDYRYRIVTLSGEVINLGGSLTGGSTYSKTSSIIGRKREIEELSTELFTLKNQLPIYLEKIKRSRSQILRLDEEILDLRDKVHFEKIEVTKAEAKVNSMDHEIIKLSNDIVALEAEKLSEENKLQLANKKIEEMNIDIAKYVSLKEELQQNLSKVELKLKDKLQHIESIKDGIVEAKIKKAQVYEVIKNKNAEIERLSEEISLYNEKMLVFSKEIEETINNKHASEITIESTERKVNEIMITLQKMEANFENTDIEKIKLKEKVKISVEKLDNVVMTLEKSEKELYKCELTLSKVKLEKDSQYEKLNEDFEITYAEALEFKNEIEDPDVLKKEITQLKAAISMLGKVNVGAIEEYKEVKEKFTFMDNQKEDLMLAKNELITVISEMTEKMKEIFAENFIILRQNFNETFMELFKGGSADLLLTEGDELSGKIDINVQPPGKKLQNLSLMSGGEKVLSAIALLFAILKMKPTPFCILDEIEAALDDANVVRYAEFLKKFSDNVQFIIITHRKGTMEASDVLYGVTMEEKGVSKIVSVEFSK